MASIVYRISLCKDEKAVRMLLNEADCKDLKCLHLTCVNIMKQQDILKLHEKVIPDLSYDILDETNHIAALVTKELKDRHLKYPEYADFQKRLDTFKTWSSEEKVTAFELCQAGFFYLKGQNDVVCCFCCGVKLWGWELQDIPWFEHFKYMDKCIYLTKVRQRDETVSTIISSAIVHQHQIGSTECDLVERGPVPPNY